jgi:large subunit ribosomal protein L30
MAVRVTQVRSVIGTKRPHRGTLRALGLHGIGTSRVHEDSPTFRGMVHQVQYLVSVEEDITTEAASAAAKG